LDHKKRDVSPNKMAPYFFGEAWENLFGFVSLSAGADGIIESLD
jgi:hypothetical protein